MFDQSWTSVEAIDKAFSEHLDSLKTSRLPFNEADLMAEWKEAKDNFAEGSTLPPWKTESL